MNDFRPMEAGYGPLQDGSMPATAAMPSPLDHLFPPEKQRVDALPPGRPKHEFETEDRRRTDWPRRRAIAIDNLILFGVFVLLTRAIRGYLGAGVFTVALALSYFFVMEATT